MGRLHRLDDSQDGRRQLAGGLQVGIDAGKLALLGSSPQQQVRRLLEGRLLRQVVDGVAAIAQLARLAVDKSSFRALEIDIPEAA
jgi:hypothetical protein